ARHAVAESPRAQRRRPRPPGCGIHPLGGDSAVVLGIHHVGIVVKRLRDAYTFYQGTLGLPLLREAEVADQGVSAALLGAGATEVELLGPLDPGSARRPLSAARVSTSSASTRRAWTPRSPI